METYKEMEKKLKSSVRKSRENAGKALAGKGKKKRWWKIILLFVLCIAVGLLLFYLLPHIQNISEAVFPGENTVDFPETAGEFIPAEVVYVVDGDTLDAAIGSEKVRIRLIGIDAPESSHPDKEENSPEGDLAAGFLSACIPKGTQIYLEKDVSDTDRYGRKLYYVWLAIPEEDISLAHIQEYMLNAKLVREGYAQAVEFPPDTAYSEVFSHLEKAARKEEAGLWKTGCGE